LQPGHTGSFLTPSISPTPQYSPQYAKSKILKHENTISNKSAKEFEQIIPTGPLQNILNHVARLKL
jgi:hypothetical protein